MLMKYDYSHIILLIKVNNRQTNRFDKYDNLRGGLIMLKNKR